MKRYHRNSLTTSWKFIGWLCLGKNGFVGEADSGAKRVTGWIDLSRVARIGNAGLQIDDTNRESETETLSEIKETGISQLSEKGGATERKFRSSAKRRELWPAKKREVVFDLQRNVPIGAVFVSPQEKAPPFCLSDLRRLLFDASALRSTRETPRKQRPGVAAQVSFVLAEVWHQKERQIAHESHAHEHNFEFD